MLPADTPVTSPVLAPTTAIAVLLLLHEPPTNEQLRVEDAPTHAEVVPVMVLVTCASDVLGLFCVAMEIGDCALEEPKDKNNKEARKTFFIRPDFNSKFNKVTEKSNEF